MPLLKDSKTINLFSILESLHGALDGHWTCIVMLTCYVCAARVLMLSKQLSLVSQNQDLKICQVLKNLALHATAIHVVFFIVIV